MVRITNTNSIHCNLKEPNNEILPSRQFTKSCCHSRNPCHHQVVQAFLEHCSAEVILYVPQCTESSFARSIRSRHMVISSLTSFITSPIKALLAGVRLRQYLNTLWMFEQKLFPFLDFTVSSMRG